MVQKNQYTYNVPPGPSDYIYNEARRAEFCIRKRIFEFQKGRWNMRILKILKSWNVLFTEGWIDGWMDGWMDGMDGWGIKSVLQFSLYFVCI